jgi:type I restriction enzyme, S subunit
VGRIRPKDELRSEFLTLLLTGKSFADYLTPIFTGISVPHLSPEQIRSFYIALPTDSEQWEIVRWTAEKTRKIRAPILGAEREIELLREYRTRLIADVVTGKIDVLEAAARLPKDVDEAGQLDETESELDSEDVGEAVEGVGEEIEA